MTGIPVTEEAKLELRRKRRNRRIWVYGGLVAGLYSAYVWQPYEIDFIPRRPPHPNPPVDPGRSKLFAKGTRILVVTAHPDDSEFYIGGSLLQLGKTADIHQVVCTDGDKGYYGPFANPEENRTVRQAEGRAAMAAWGGHQITFLSHPDGRLRSDSELVQQLVTIMQSFRPEYVLAFDGDYPPRMSHQDHRRSGDAALLAAKRCGVPKWCLLFSSLAPNFVVDITEDWERKKELLAIHKSQFSGNKLERVANMVASTAETEGELRGFSLGEGFRCVEIPSAKP